VDAAAVVSGRIVIGELDMSLPADRALAAAIEFLLEHDRVDGLPRWRRALVEHRAARDGLCRLHQARWPCVTWELAEAARAASTTVLPIPHQRRSAR
jgi:hypothetical protein